jgi:hypothetical protein
MACSSFLSSPWLSSQRTFHSTGKSKPYCHQEQSPVPVGAPTPKPTNVHWGEIDVPDPYDIYIIFTYPSLRLATGWAGVDELKDRQNLPGSLPGTCSPPKCRRCPGKRNLTQVAGVYRARPGASTGDCVFVFRQGIDPSFDIGRCRSYHSATSTTVSVWLTGRDRCGSPLSQPSQPAVTNRLFL